MSCITIQSADKNNSVHIEPSESGYRITASFQGESITNKCVRFTGVHDFVKTLAEVVRSHNGWAILDGTEDCRLVVEADQELDHRWLTFHVARHFKVFNPRKERSRASFIMLSGSFPISDESYGKMTQGLTELFEQHESKEFNNLPEPMPDGAGL
jgi:hypothetical protein